MSVGHELEGRIAVVTGASKGLGRATAVALARAGLQVVVAARNRAKLDETAAIIEQETGRTALVVPTDVSDQTAVTSLCAQTSADLGQATVLINAAAIFGPLAPFSDCDPQQWIETMMINSVGPFLTCRAFVQGMRDVGWGRIINVSSSASLSPPGPLDSAYATSKAALNRMTRHLAAELDGTGVTANVLHPGSVKTEMWGDIGRQAAVLGEAAADFNHWAELIEEDGGDPMSKATDLILELIGDNSGQINGRFCWLHDGLEDPIDSW